MAYSRSTERIKGKTLLWPSLELLRSESCVPLVPCSLKSATRSWSHLILDIDRGLFLDVRARRGNFMFIQGSSFGTLTVETRALCSINCIYLF